MGRISNWLNSGGSSHGGTESSSAPNGVSAYDGKPNRAYRGNVNGRKVTVYSSWKPGDPER